MTGLGRRVALRIGAAVFAVLSCFSVPASDNLDFGVPACDRVLERDGYAVGWSDSRHAPLWVQYRLTADETTNCVVRRGDCFATDREVPDSPTPRDMRGFDRGHLAPASDMLWSDRAMRESFLMTNMSPMLPSFNRGIWAHVEGKVREYAVRFGTLAVITAPVYDSTNRVPVAFCKVVCAESNGCASVAFVVPHGTCSTAVWDHARSVSFAERLTGLRFLGDLDGVDRDRLPDESEWRVGR